jgi:tetratricopeptide (TPR) repeat protein
MRILGSTFSRKTLPRALLALLLLACGCEDDLKNVADPRERFALEQVFREARALDDAGRYHEALVRYETILSQHPEYVSTRLNAAMAAYDSGQYQKAADHFEVLHKAGPTDWFVIRKLIQCHERLGNDEAVRAYRAKLDTLRQQKDGSLILKSYEGLTRDYIPMGSMHLIGYEFFEPKKHGRLWLFKLEDRNHATVSTFLLESTTFFDPQGRRLFCMTEANRGWLNIWHVGVEGRDYKWARDFAIECLQGKREPLVTKPMPPEYVTIAIPEVAGPEHEESPANPPPFDPPVPKR